MLSCSAHLCLTSTRSPRKTRAVNTLVEGRKVSRLRFSQSLLVMAGSGYQRRYCQRSSRRRRALTNITASPATNNAATPPMMAVIAQMGRSSIESEGARAGGAGAARLPPEEPVDRPASGVDSCVGVAVGRLVAAGVAAGRRAGGSAMPWVFPLVPQSDGARAPTSARRSASVRVMP